MIEPTIKIQGNKQNLLDNLERELIEKFAANLTIFTISIEEGITKNCVQLQNIIKEDPYLLFNGLPMIPTVIDSYIIVKNESGAILNIKRNRKDIFIERGNVDNVFFKMYQSEELDEIDDGIMSDCEKLNQNEYSIESVKKKEEIFQTKINKTKEEYEDNHENLKNELNIPSGSEFGFIFTDKNEIIIETEEKNVSTSVYSEEIPLLYVDREANIKPGFINIRVW
jgi:hypothetical protein